jgi:GT2 family glycosyltransferase
MKPPTVSITILTFNSARFIAKCLEYVLEQDYPEIQIVVIDNASTDGTAAILHEFGSRIKVVQNDSNVGFAAGQNQAIALTSSDWVLTLNPDVRLRADFVSQLVAAGDCDEKIGALSGKLLRMGADFSVPASQVIDSAGIYFTPELRHFDRGSGEPDGGHYDQFEYVFGVTGAAGFYRREMIEDVSINREFFDSDFFAYREDADLAWRAQLLGWKCAYNPNAIAYHIRSVLPSNRGSVSTAINRHSVKNRFLMRIKNSTWDVYPRHFLAITWRDVLIVGACLLREWSSLPAFVSVLRMLPKMLCKRREIMARRRVDSKAISAWFSHAAVSFSAPELASKIKTPVAAPR